MAREVAREVRLLVHVANLVEHLRHVALAKLRVLDRVDELAGALHGGVLAEVHHRHRDLHDLHPATLRLGGRIGPRERVLERAVLSVVLLLLHRKIVAQQVAERILGLRGNLVAGGVADRLLRVGRLPVEIFDSVVSFDEASHEDSPSCAAKGQRPTALCAPYSPHLPPPGGRVLYVESPIGRFAPKVQ